MISQRTTLLAAGALVAVGAIGFSLTNRKASTTASHTVIADYPLELIEENKEEAIFVRLPTQMQKERLSKLFGDHPRLLEEADEVRRKVYTTQIVALNKRTNQLSTKPFKLHRIKYKDPGIYKEFTWDLLSYQNERGQNFIAEPESATPPLSNNPANPDIKLSSYNQDTRYQYFFVFDNKTQKMKRIGDIPPQKPGIYKSKIQTEGPSFLYYWALHPVWSPDGKQIAFISNRDRWQSPRYEIRSIWIHDLPTGREYRLNPNDNSDYKTVGWTPDGRIIAQEYLRNEPAPQEILAIVDPKTGQKQKLTDGEFLKQSKDLKYLLYVRRTRSSIPARSLNALSFTTGKSETVLPQYSGSQNISFSEDNTQILTDISDGKAGIKTLFAYNLQTGKAAYLPLQKLRRIVVYPQWVNNQVVVSTETLSLRNFASETLLVPSL